VQEKDPAHLKWGAVMESMEERVARELCEGSRECYQKVQGLVLQAMKTQDRIYGDMIMRITWGLLPDEAREKIRGYAVEKAFKTGCAFHLRCSMPFVRLSHGGAR